MIQFSVSTGCFTDSGRNPEVCDAVRGSLSQAFGLLAQGYVSPNPSALDEDGGHAGFVQSLFGRICWRGSPP